MMRRGNRIIANSRFQALMVCVCSALGLFWGHCANALEYTEATWGFDGRVVPDQFNLLTVVVHNPAQMPFEGVVRLEQAQGFAKWGGTEIKPCYLDPGGSRTLQFYPRITGMNGWRLSDGIHTEDLDAPKHGIPALVRLVDGDDPLQVNHQIKAFPHQRFPTTVGGTSGLYALVVDDVPKFAPSQKAAFVDWVMAGGRLHVL